MIYIIKFESKQKIKESLNILQSTPSFNCNNLSKATNLIWESIGIIKPINGNNFKIYDIDIPNSKSNYEGIKIGLDNNIIMEIGDDLGMIAHLIPHDYRISNPYYLLTSDSNIIDVNGMMLIYKKVQI